jgi:hypothetical protein
MIRHIFNLLAAAAVCAQGGCMSLPSGLDTSLERTTAQAKYRVALHPLAEPVPVNSMHAWEIRLLTPAGEPVRGAQIEVGGGMPQHGHGLPTQPRVTRDAGDGRYLLEGMKFSMPGWWEIKLKVAAAGGNDSVTFNTVIAAGTAPASATGAPAR